MRTVEYVRKGMNCLTEMYSVIEAEVPVPTDPGTTKNKKLLAELSQSKRLIVCGQALSHCVCWTVEDILTHWATLNISYGKMFLLKDGTSSVYGHEKAGQEKTATWRERGVIITETTQAFDRL